MDQQLLDRRGQLSFVGIGWLLQDSFMWGPTYPAEDSKQRSTGTFEQVGGPTARALMMTARLGSQARIASVVGDDVRGTAVLQELADFGVDTWPSSTLNGTATRTAHVWLSTDSGSRTIRYNPEGGDLVLPDDGEVGRWLSGGTALLLDGRFARTALAVAAAARTVGMLVALDLGGRKSRHADLIAVSDVVVGGRESWSAAAEAAGRNSIEAYIDSLADKVCVVTRGPDTMLLQADGMRVRKSPPAVTVVDSNGAGDTFFGGLVWARTLGLPPERAVEVAMCAAALKCRGLGNPSLPTLDQLVEFVLDQYGWRLR